MTIITGQPECKQFVAAQCIGWKHSTFLVHGEGSESSYHEWELMLHLVSDAERRYFGLEETGFPGSGDGSRNLDDEDEDEDPKVYVVAIVEAPGADDVTVLRALLAAHLKAHGRQLDFIHETSELWDALKSSVKA